MIHLVYGFYYESYFSNLAVLNPLGLDLITELIHWITITCHIKQLHIGDGVFYFSLLKNYTAFFSHFEFYMCQIIKGNMTVCVLLTCNSFPPLYSERKLLHHKWEVLCVSEVQGHRLILHTSKSKSPELPCD